MRGLYIHIPFCRHICNYCDFPKRIPRSEEAITFYIEHLLQEIEAYRAFWPSIRTIYIGGGTPSILTNDSLEQLLSFLSQIENINEFTMEINPEEFTLEKAIIMKKNGINRVSIGGQSFNSRILKELGRKHTKKDIVTAIKHLKNAGITNINLDLMYAIPNMHKKNIKADLKTFYSLKIPHISYYSMILEEKTVFYHQYKNNKLLLIDEDTEADMAEYIIKSLKKHHFHHYEISNFAKKGFESIHNQLYWQNEEYVGVGAGASGYLNGIRYKNNQIIDKYYFQYQMEKEEISPEMQVKEALLLGLRMIDGVNIPFINQKYKTNIFTFFPEIEKLINKGLLKYENDQLLLTKRGYFLANFVFEEFI